MCSSDEEDMKYEIDDDLLSLNSDLAGIQMRQAKKEAPVEDLAHKPEFDTSEKILYHAFDFHTNSQILGFHTAFHRCQLRCKSAINSTGFFFDFIEKGSFDNSGPLYGQKGVIRVNCVDCLDRTNVASLAIALEMTSRCLLLYECFPSTASQVHIPVPIFLEDKEAAQLKDPLDLAICTIDSRVVPDSNVKIDWGETGRPEKFQPEISGVAGNLPLPILSLLADTWGEVGDDISACYAGSEAMHRAGFVINDKGQIETYRRGNTAIAVKRFLSNMVDDFDKQRAMDIFTGKFQPSKETKHIWETQPFPSMEQRKLWSLGDAPTETSNQTLCGESSTPWMCIFSGCVSQELKPSQEELELNILSQEDSSGNIKIAEESKSLRLRQGTFFRQNT
eukprot:GHVP01031974.1.p2 GENE.GHVP01031974.1~~GHVP01031974.1.p2  ORF type:complete len:392 (-),score=81.99 GHVP01031974.1:995-2170(-)